MKGKLWVVWAVFGMSVCLLTGNPARAQESRGAIVGQVMDSAGAVIPGAGVVVKNVETGQIIKLTTNESGAYVAPLLLVGSYSIEVEQTGFNRAVRPNVQVGVGDRLQVDFQLQVGEMQQSVTVTEAAPLLQAADASLGAVVDLKRVADLPLAHGNPYALIGLATGTAFDGDPKLNRPFEPTHIVGYSISGTRNGTSDVTLDGVANTAVTGRSSNTNGNTVTASYVPPADAVAEFRVQTAAFDAKMGQTPGGLVNISLKSGTNKLHGTAYYTKMAPEMVAREFFAKATGDFTYNRWGASLNGPVELPKLYNGHDRTFFMWAYEGIKESRSRASTNRSPFQRPPKGTATSPSCWRWTPGTRSTTHSPAARRRAAGIRPTRSTETSSRRNWSIPRPGSFWNTSPCRLTRGRLRTI